MGLDGGTYITRSDVLRGQSWELSTADNSRSTRGGNASTSAAKTRKTIDPRTAKYAYSSCHRAAGTASIGIVDFSVYICRLTVLSACKQEYKMVNMLPVQPTAASANCSRLLGQLVQPVS